MAKKNTIKRIKSSDKNLETSLATAYRLLREARAHVGGEWLGDTRYIGTAGDDEESVEAWFAEVDQLVGPAFPGGGVQLSSAPMAGGVDDDINSELDALFGC